MEFVSQSTDGIHQKMREEYVQVRVNEKIREAMAKTAHADRVNNAVDGAPAQPALAARPPIAPTSAEGAADAGSRERLHREVKSYQAEHPSVPYRDALTTVTGLHKAAAATGPRAELHREAKTYQAQHPGVPYMQAIHTVGRLAAAGAVGERGELHRKALTYQAAHPGASYLDAVTAVSMP